MPKMYNVRELILEMLEEKDLSVEAISRGVRKKLDEKILDKTINEALMSLLKERKIEIIDYDFKVYNGKRMQSIKMEGITFSLTKNSTFEIELLLRELESNDLKRAMKSYKMLKRKFKNKMKDIEAEWEKDWENLRKTLISESFDTEGKQKNSSLKGDFKSNDQNSEKLDLKKGSIPDEDISDGTVMLKTFSCNINMNKERSINFVGCIPPKKMNTAELDHLFDKLIDYISSQELIPKKILLHNLKLGLSENKKSTQALKKLISCIEILSY